VSSFVAHALSETSEPFLRWEEDPGQYTCQFAHEMGGLLKILTIGL
jgi:hypothetical protein